ncbi:MAG: BON domain-containing protein [Bryobacteraceae bacterium]
MKTGATTRILMAAALLAGAALGATKDSFPKPATDDEIAKQVRHVVLTYPYYGVWDQVGLFVHDGQVELNGAVTEPYKKADLARLVERIPGIAGVTNEIKVLPPSPMDDRLRRQVARAIFGYAPLTRYAAGPVPSIHIVVDSGRVTLSGRVSTDGDKQLAGIRAAGAGLSLGQVVNNLEVEHPSARKS